MCSRRSILICRLAQLADIAPQIEAENLRRAGHVGRNLTALSGFLRELLLHFRKDFVHRLFSTDLGHVLVAAAWWRPGYPCRTAYDGVHASDEFKPFKRLRHEIIGTGTKAVELDVQLVKAREDQNRSLHSVPS